MSFYSVHTPIQPKENKVDKYIRKQSSNGQNNARYAAMVESVDENVGRLMNCLDVLNLTDNTVVFFTSDNGGVRRITSMAPLRAGKGSYYEGGIREPLVVRWPSKIKAGIQCDTPVSGIDFYPTILEITKTSKPAGKILDGISLTPLLTQQQTIKDRALFWHFPIYLQSGNDETRDTVFRTRPGSVIRYGDWKLHEYFEDNAIELYNLKDDIGELNNLTTKYPDKVKELHQKLISWRDSIGAPVPKELNPEYDKEYDMKLREKK